MSAGAFCTDHTHLVSLYYILMLRLCAGERAGIHTFVVFFPAVREHRQRASEALCL